MSDGVVDHPRHLQGSKSLLIRGGETVEAALADALARYEAEAAALRARVRELEEAHRRNAEALKRAECRCNIEEGFFHDPDCPVRLRALKENME